jgi:hypothetical protein
LKEDDKQRLKNLSGQIRNYLEEITSESTQTSTQEDDTLSGRVADKIGSKLNQDLKQFSSKLIEKKKRSQIQDLATTRMLPNDN